MRFKQSILNEIVEHCSFNVEYELQCKELINHLGDCEEILTDHKCSMCPFSKMNTIDKTNICKNVQCKNKLLRTHIIEEYAYAWMYLYRNPEEVKKIKKHKNNFLIFPEKYSIL